MCVSPLISPLGSLFGGHSSSPLLAAVSPLGALASGAFKKKPQPDRLTALYPNGG